MPLFSIIVVHYQGTIPRETYLRGINSILAQTCKDFEVLVYHDGPLLDPEAPTPVPIRCTEARHNDWGHSLRDRGIREATGDYIVHFNADNVLYPIALETIAKEIARPPRLAVKGKVLDRNSIIIFPVIMYGLHRFFQQVYQFKDRTDFYEILSGNPPMLQNIDCMQFVMKRELWLREGGWHDKREMSDGFMYPKLAVKYGYRLCGPVLGEHY